MPEKIKTEEAEVEPFVHPLKKVTGQRLEKHGHLATFVM